VAGPRRRELFELESVADAVGGSKVPTFILRVSCFKDAPGPAPRMTKHRRHSRVHTSQAWTGWPAAAYEDVPGPTKPNGVAATAVAATDTLAANGRGDVGHADAATSAPAAKPGDRGSAALTPLALPPRPSPPTPRVAAAPPGGGAAPGWSVRMCRLRELRCPNVTPHTRHP